jgi:rhomboid family GlyGly-CTERM serine protease
MYGKQAQTALTVWITTALAAIMATYSPDYWALDSEKVMHGEWWRLVTGHLSHVSWRHCLYDTLAFGPALYLCAVLGNGFSTVIITTLLSGCAVSMVVVIAHPVDVYGGLSGITAGFLSFAILGIIRDNPVSGMILLVGLMIKICIEQRGVALSGVTPVWQAHCAGAVAGATVFACLSMPYREDGPYQQAFGNSQQEGKASNKTEAIS